MTRPTSQHVEVPRVRLIERGMAKFRLQEGEQVIERCRAKDSGGAWQDQGELILTDQRIVVTRTRASGLAGAFGLIGALISPPETRVEYEIKRGRFESAEAASPKELTVRSTGEGYAMTRFDLKLKGADAWADRLHRWAADAPQSDLPQAKLVKSD